MDYLIEHFRAEKDVRGFFDAKLMKTRLELGLPLIQTESSSAFPEDKRVQYDQAMIAAARETGMLALQHNDIPRAWPYFRAIGERSLKPRKNKRREKIPRRVAGLIAGGRPKSRQSTAKTSQI